MVSVKDTRSLGSRERPPGLFKRPLKGVLKMLPGMNADVLDKAKIDDRQFVQVEAIINSMTPGERRKPDIINGSRRKRIARGSGTTVSQVNKLLKQFDQSRKLMKKLTGSGKGGSRRMSRRLPKGMLPF